MLFLELADCKIHYAMSGAAGAPVLLFSNSLGTTFSMWDGQLSTFEKHRVLRYDTRGHGQSSVTPGPYSAAQLGKDVLDLLDALKIDGVSYCGLSMGGMIGMWLATNAPERLRKLVLCNTAAKFGTPDIWNARMETVHKGGMNSIATSVIERWFTPAFRASHPTEVAAVLHNLENASPQGYLSNCAAVRDFDHRAALSGIRVPTLVVTGAHDPSTPPTEGRFIAEHIPGARCVELSAAHLSNIEARDAFNREVSSFLLA